MIPELITALKYVGLIGGGGVSAIIIRYYLGKTKEETEIVLNWEEIHEKRYQSLLKEITMLKTKVAEIAEVLNRERETHRQEILAWEKSDDIWRSKDKENKTLIHDQETELETLRDGTD